MAHNEQIRRGILNDQKIRQPVKFVIRPKSQAKNNLKEPDVHSREIDDVPRP